MVDMAIHQILPAALSYTRTLCESVAAKEKLGMSCRAELSLIKNLSAHTDALYDAVENLKKAMSIISKGDPEVTAAKYHNRVVPAMQALRAEADALEELTDKSFWPYPTYSDLLYY